MPKKRVKCIVIGCSKEKLSRKLCSTHYSRWLKYSSPYIKFRGNIKTCTLDGCEGKFYSNGFCMKHNSRLRRNGTTVSVRKKSPIQTKRGYVKIKNKEHANSDKGGWVFEHTIVMSNHIGRSLRKGESVHHKNNIKYDNRIENLELWKRGHPNGARISDLTEWAIEHLKKYKPEALLDNHVCPVLGRKGE